MTQTAWLRLAADAVVLLHFAFLLFVVAGGFLVMRWPRVAWVHLPCAVWGIGIEFTGWICPLTPLENYLRRLAGQEGYAGGFIERYITAVMYPEGLTRDIQAALGAAALLINVLAYAYILRRRTRRSAPDSSSPPP